ncbi:hypothetical protein NFI96_014586, partial [Prochilodus magdalenae]
VIKCIVEVLADVLSKPHSIPVSQQCLQTLRTDDRLVTVLRHHNFLQELQDIAVEGANERPEKRMKDSAEYVSHHSEDPEAVAVDRSMLVAMERPGEEKRGKDEERNREHEEKEKKMQEHHDISSQEKRNEAEKDSDAMNEEPERKRAAMKKKGANEVEEEKHSSLGEEEEDEAAGAGVHSEVKKSAEEESQEEAVERRRESLGQLEEEKAKAGMKHWSRTRQLAHRRAEMGAYDQQETTHHSKEVPGQGEGEVWKSPEEQELQMMARSDPEDRREEEGSASKKTE